MALNRAQLKDAWLDNGLSAYNLSLAQAGVQTHHYTGLAHDGSAFAPQKQAHRLSSTLHWSKCSLNAPWPTDSLCTSLRCHSYLAAGAGSSTLPATCTMQQLPHGLSWANTRDLAMQRILTSPWSTCEAWSVSERHCVATYACWQAPKSSMFLASCYARNSSQCQRPSSSTKLLMTA